MERSNLSMLQKIMYAMGNMGGNFLGLLFTTWITRFYCPPPGVGTQLLNIKLVTRAIFAGRIVDGVADPPIGYISDRTRTRWGRRMPFIVLCGLPLCLVFFLLWIPPTGVFPPFSTKLFAYFVGLMALYWILYTAVLCPYLGLLPEIVTSKKERIDLCTYLAVFMIISTLLAGVGAPEVIDRWGFKTMGAVFAVLSLISIYATPLAIREKPHGPPTQDENYGFFTAFKWTFSNRPFVIYITSSVFLHLGFNVILVSIPYVVNVLLGKTDKFAQVLFGITMIGAIVSFAPMNILSKRIGKKKMFLISILVMGLVLPMIYLFGNVELPLDLLAVSYVIFFLMGFPVAAISILPNALLADIVDHDEKQTGQRREAMYFGMQGILQKFAIGFASLLQGALFSAYGFAKGNHLGISLLGPVAGALVLLGFVVFLFYPLDDRSAR